MPIYFADNWSISRTSDTLHIAVTFWLAEKLYPYVQSIKRTNKLSKRKVQVLYQHKIIVNNLQYNERVGGWVINDKSNVITLHLNRRDYIPVYLQKSGDSEDVETEDDYVRVKKNFVQTEDEITNVIKPQEKPSNESVEETK